MNTAYFGDGPSRRGSPVRFLVAALALAFLPVGAIAQTPPAESAPAVDVDTSIPGVTEEAAAPAPLTTKRVLRKLTTPSAFRECGPRATSSLALPSSS